MHRLIIDPNGISKDGTSVKVNATPEQIVAVINENPKKVLNFDMYDGNHAESEKLLYGVVLDFRISTLIKNPQEDFILLRRVVDKTGSNDAVTKFKLFMGDLYANHFLQLGKDHFFVKKLV